MVSVVDRPTGLSLELAGVSIKQVVVSDERVSPATVELNREVEKVPEEEEKKHEEDMTGLVPDESLLSEADSKLSGVSFVLAVGLSEAVISVRAEIKSAPPWAAGLSLELAGVSIKQVVVSDERASP